jgi:hypothetical protein
LLTTTFGSPTAQEICSNYSNGLSFLSFLISKTNKPYKFLAPFSLLREILTNFIVFELDLIKKFMLSSKTCPLWGPKKSSHESPQMEFVSHEIFISHVTIISNFMLEL